MEDLYEIQYRSLVKNSLETIANTESNEALKKPEETIDHMEEKPSSVFPPSGPRGKRDEGFFRTGTTNEEFKLYPNPTHNYITLQYNNVGQYSSLSYSLNDQSGKMLLNQELNTQERETLIDLSMLKAGVYTLVVYGDNNIIETHKITVVK
jgi:hypothetical protein